MLLRFLAGRSREEDATALLAMSSMYSRREPAWGLERATGRGTGRGAGTGSGEDEGRGRERLGRIRILVSTPQRDPSRPPSEQTPNHPHPVRPISVRPFAGVRLFCSAQARSLSLRYPPCRPPHATRKRPSMHADRSTNAPVLPYINITEVSQPPPRPSPTPSPRACALVLFFDRAHHLPDAGHQQTVLEYVNPTSSPRQTEPHRPGYAIPHPAKPEVEDPPSSSSTSPGSRIMACLTRPHPLQEPS